MLVDKLCQRLNIVGHKAQTMHARVEFDMDFKFGDFGMQSQCVYQLSQIVEVEDLWLQAMVDHHLETVRLGTQHDYRILDFAFTQVNAFISVGNCQIINIMILQFINQLGIAQTIGQSLHHRRHLGLGLQQTAVVVEVVDDGGQADLQHGAMCLKMQLVNKLLKAELTGTLDEDGLLLEDDFGQMLQGLFGGLEEILLVDMEHIAVLEKGGPHCNQLCYLIINQKII